MNDFYIHLQGIIHLWLSTLTIPFSEVSEISEGDLIFLAMELVPREDLGFGESKVPKCWNLSTQVFLNNLVLGDVSRVSSVDCKKEEEAKTNYALYKHCQALINFLIKYGKWIPEFSINK